ncbi:uncharacterized protein DUF1801 [Tumebacillus sp. BK434]|uniref:DUF1801 domain-containing protein n=1 Tax=Tumebacillus sp. BK434 TaxID=2512169 RepID=UPI0010EBAC23|nr:DUF1801 domain-containing protein [Tumebacillus sp. BK434]TCP58103.1 uncharacterized protein DUF1801 [Tumebacillus sp. BK434]
MTPVEQFMQQLNHPLKPEIEAVRQIILRTDSRITEQIKWNAPSFCFQQEDRVTFNLQGKGFFRLIFHCGAKAKQPPLQAPLIEDTTGLLEWAANDRAILKLTSMEDVQAKEEQIAELVRRWIEAAQ